MAVELIDQVLDDCFDRYPFVEYSVYAPWHGEVLRKYHGRNWRRIKREVRKARKAYYDDLETRRFQYVRYEWGVTNWPL